jgi:hypothetical protein
MMATRRNFMLRSALLSTLFTCCLSAATHDLAADFSYASNPNGPWEYRSDTLTTMVFDANWLPSLFATAQPAWAAGDDVDPSWFVSSATPLFAADFLPGDVVGLSQAFSFFGSPNIIWTSPEAGFLDISLDIWRASNLNGVPVEWRLLHNGSQVANGILFEGDPFDRANPATASFLNLPLAIGDTVTLVTGGPSLGEFVGVGLTLNAHTASAVPEPGTLLLLAAAVPIFAALRRRQ